MNVVYEYLLVVLMGFPLTIMGQSADEPVVWINEVGIHGIHGWNISSFKDQERGIKAKWAEIGNSLASSSSPFAGTYEEAGNTGSFLRWSPEKGFVYAVYHEDWIVSVSYGDATVLSSGIIHFIVIHENQHEWLGHKLRTPVDWIPVVRGDYFIPAEAIKSFSDFYGGYGDFNGFPRRWNCECGPFPQRLAKETRRLPGFLVPNIYLSQLRQPIYGHIKTIGKSYVGKHPVPFGFDERASLTSVTVDIGRKNGVRTGLLFLISPGENAMDQFLKITRVGETHSWGVVVRELDEHGNLTRRDLNAEGQVADMPYPKLEVGQEIATSFVNKLQ